MDEAEARRLERKHARQMRRREEIADAAERLIDRHGIDGFTTSELAEAANVSQGSLFYYFEGGAAEIMAMVGVRWFLEDAARVVEAIEAADDGGDALTAMVRARIRRYLEDPERTAFQLEAFSAGLMPDWLLESFYRHINAVFEAVERQLTEDPKVAWVEDPRRLAMTAHHMTSGLIRGDALRRRAGGESRHTLADMADDLCAVLKRGLYAAELPSTNSDDESS